MKIEKNKHYKIKINHFGRELTYEGNISYLEKGEFGLKIKEESCPLQFNTKDIIFAKETEKPKEENKIFKISNKKQFTNLKRSTEPDF